MSYHFEAELWQYQGQGAWYFVTLPVEVATQIRTLHSHEARGWGSLPVEVSIQDIRWNTSIFPDKRSGSYLLPIKLDIRKQLGIQGGDNLIVDLQVRS